jgi:ABC-type phosphate/phosphonate transport system substrate-binding protein
LYPRAIIRAAGLDPDKDFSATRFGGDHLQTLKALHKGACDGAATYATNWHEGGKHDMPPQDFRPIATTDRIPDDAYVLSPSVDAQTAAKIEQALIALEPKSPLARRVMVEPAKDSSQDIVGFVKATDKDYESVRTYLREEAQAKEQ